MLNENSIFNYIFNFELNFLSGSLKLTKKFNFSPSLAIFCDATLRNITIG